MKLQNIYINNRFDHVIDYDSNDEFVENFVIQTPAHGDTMSLITFSTIDNKETFRIETEKQTEKYYFIGGKITMNDKETALKKMQITLSFSYKKEDVEQIMENSSSPKMPSFHKPIPVKTKPEELDEIVCSEDFASISWADEESNSHRVLNLNMDGLNESCIELELILNLLSHINGKDKSKTKKLHLYIAPQKYISDVILDFGSEASQMTVFNRDSDIDITGFADLFTKVRSEFAEQGVEDKFDDYYQYDASSPKLFRSQFFIKKEVQNDDVDQAKQHLFKVYKDQENSLIKVLTTKQEVQNMHSSYFVAPNIKLSSFGGIELPKVLLSNGDNVTTDNVGGKDVYFYYRASISLFIVQALKEVLSQGQAMNFISFHFLMPNVYEQQEIVKILHLLQQDIAQVIKEKEFSCIKGFEVTAVSESDASVMGVCELKNSKDIPLDEGNYLLLDAGKGTLDFSLIKYSFDEHINQYTYKNLWRSGIIGAGNSLTYAYFIALVHQYLDIRYDKNEGDVDAHDIKQFIYTNILGRQIVEGDNVVEGAGDSSLLLNMMRAVDKYKKYASCDNLVIEDDGASSNNLNKLQLGAFVDWLETCVDETKQTVVALTHPDYVDKMINSLVNETVNIIYQMQAGRGEECSIDKIIFSGRAFNLQAFKNKMWNALRQKYESISEESFLGDHTAISMKDICLVCVNPIIQGNYNRKILSEPILLQKRSTLITDNIETVESKKQYNIFIRIIRKLFNMDSDNITSDVKNNDVNQSEVTSEKDVIDKIGDFLAIKGTTEQMDTVPLEGYEWTVTNPKFVRFNIGGVIHRPSVGIGMGKVNVFFDGKGYVWRSENGKSGNFVKGMKLEKSPFLQSSFFPNFIPDQIQNIKLIPEVKDNTVPNMDNLVSNNQVLGETEIQQGNHVKETGTSQSKQNALDALLSGNNK